MSFGPFLGGKRICLGKTFAENIAKCMIPVIVNKLSFEFVNPEHYQKKPQLGFSSVVPTVMVKVSETK